MELKVLGMRSKGLGGDLCGTSDALTGEPASQQGEIAPIGPDGQWPAALVAKLGGESRERGGPVWVREWIHWGPLILWPARSGSPFPLPRSSRRCAW